MKLEIEYTKKDETHPENYVIESSVITQDDKRITTYAYATKHKKGSLRTFLKNRIKVIHIK